MLDPLDPEESRKRQQGLDSELGVRNWRTGHGPAKPDRRTEEDRHAPAWWSGGDDAAQEFLNAMGVQLEGR